jgi:hypothetical protein
MRRRWSYCSDRLKYLVKTLRITLYITCWCFLTHPLTPPINRGRLSLKSKGRGITCSHTSNYFPSINLKGGGRGRVQNKSATVSIFNHQAFNNSWCTIFMIFIIVFCEDSKPVIYHIFSKLKMLKLNTHCIICC